jgi:ParG
MSTKTIPFRQPASLTRPAEEWVGASSPVTPVKAAKSDAPTKRLTVDIPEELHRRIKMHCAGHGTQISDIIRDLLTKEFPAP